MSTYICKCGRRVKKSTNADNTGNRLEGYGPGHECYGCPYVLSWGNYEWNEEAKNLEQKTKGYECRMSKTLSYASQFIGSTKDKCTCSVVSLDFGFLEQISAWVKETFTLGELTGHFSRDKIRATEYCHNGRYQYALYCAQNKKGIAAKAALFEHFFNPDGSRKDMTPQQEMEKVLADIKKATQAKEKLECTTMDSAAPSENADASSATGGAPLTTGTTLMTKPAHSAPQDKTPTSFPMNSLAAPTFDFSALGDLSGQAAEADHQFDLHYGTAQDEYLISCIYLARVHALTAKAGRYGGGTWTKWYESKGLSEGSARSMVKNGDAFKSATVAELKCLPELTRKDLNLIARSGCAEQLTAAAGDSQRVQELLAQIKAKDDAIAAEKERADAAEAQRDAAQADVAGLHEQNDHLQRSYDYANEAYKAADAQRKQAENERDKAQQRAKTAEDALKKQPITGVVDKDEVKRQAEALSRNAVQEARQQAAEAQARLRQYQEDAEGLLAPAQACAEQAQFIADSVRAMYLKWFGNAVAAGASLAQMGTPLYAVCGEIMSSLEEENTINPTAAGSEEDAEREALFE
nr:MAG TPA: Invasin ipaB, type three secretion system.05A [Caudoviricetes sp.]